jgi:peptidoglycan/LPS O-acetylase OafA/YrhL
VTQPATSPTSIPRRPHLAWVDGIKALSILWIAFFHFFTTWSDKRLPSPLAAGYFDTFFAGCAPSGIASTLRCSAEAGLGAFGQLGFHAVSVFLVMSGFGLAASAAGRPQVDWRGWFRGRFLRLYPMYWVAHVIVILAPFAWFPEPVDARIIPSLLGLRFWPPISSNFYYLNAAWWYFGLLIQLYLVFPLLWMSLRRIGAVRFFVLTLVATLAMRAALIFLWPTDGLWIQGGFFGGRLVEFSGGMVLGMLHRRDPEALESRLFSRSVLVVGIAVYAVALWCHQSLAGYVVSDALVAAGLFVLLAAAARVMTAKGGLGLRLSRVGAFSYGLYLLHQPFLITLGIHMRDLPMFGFTALAIPILAAVTWASMGIERVVNAATNRLLGAG